MTWSEGLLNTLEENDVRLVTYVPDNVLTPLIKGVTEDNDFILHNSHWIRDEKHFDELINRSFRDGGPTLLAAKNDDQPGISKMIRDPALIRNRFMMGLGTSRGGALDD